MEVLLTLENAYGIRVEDPLMVGVWLGRLGYRFHDADLGNGIDPGTHRALPGYVEACDRLDSKLGLAV